MLLHKCSELGEPVVLPLAGEAHQSYFDWKMMDQFGTNIIDPLQVQSEQRCLVMLVTSDRAYALGQALPVVPVPFRSLLRHQVA